VPLKKKFNRKQLITLTANLQTSPVGMEACAGAHFLGRALRAQEQDVNLTPAQFLKPFVQSNENDFLGAEGLAEAVDRQNMRFVPIMTSLTCKRAIDPSPPTSISRNTQRNETCDVRPIWARVSQLAPKETFRAICERLESTTAALIISGSSQRFYCGSAFRS
jgi:hypothetical protein